MTTLVERSHDPAADLSQMLGVGGRLSVTSRIGDSGCTLVLEGVLDAVSAIALYVQIEQIQSGRFMAVLVDTSGLRAVGPAGRSALLSLVAAVSEYGGTATILDDGPSTEPAG